jgi:hypothetical protein
MRSPSTDQAPSTSALPRTLGWASLGIGMAELLAPRTIARWLGVDPGRSGLLRALGVREVGHGVDLLAHRDPAPGIHARVAGDALDGALLGVAATRTRNPGGFAALSAAVLGIVALDLLCAVRLHAR